MHLYVVDLRAVGHDVQGPSESRHLRRRRKQLPLRRVYLDVSDERVVLRGGPKRSMFAHVHEQLRFRADGMRQRHARDLHSRKQRLLGVRAGGGLWGAADVYRRVGLVGLHVQRGSIVPLHGKRVRKRLEHRKLRAGWQRVLLRGVDIAV